MKTPPLTLEQQRDYVRRLTQGWKAANDGQAQGAAQRSEAEKWVLTDELQRMSDSLRGNHPPLQLDPEMHGLVEQQRFFMRLRCRP